MLPDSFGFPASLPTILAHAGLTGFSTQKLGGRWPAVPEVGGTDSPEQTPDGVPFNVGVWVGPDGKSVIAALHPGAYGSSIYTDLSEAPSTSMEQTLLSSAQKPSLTEEQSSALRRLLAIDTDWIKRIDLDGKASGVFADYRYVGTGDTGGAPQESTVKLLEAIATKSETILPSLPKLNGAPSFPAQSVTVRVGEGPVHVVESSADQMFNAITPEMAAHMPRYEGDLELTDHSAGSLTSQAYHKRWIIKDENLADAAEKASIAAQWLGARDYPQQRLNDAWMLALAGHFHDTGAGTSTPRAYQYAWNDDVIAANQFAAVLTSASAAVSSSLDTRTQGIPVVVYNPLSIARQDLVEAAVVFPDGVPKAVRVYGPDGQETPAQWEDSKVLFLASIPSVGYAVFDVRAAAQPTANNNVLRASDRSLEISVIECFSTKVATCRVSTTRSLPKSCSLRLSGWRSRPTFLVIIQRGTWTSHRSRPLHAPLSAGLRRFASARMPDARLDRSDTANRRLSICADRESLLRAMPATASIFTMQSTGRPQALTSRPLFR